MVDNRRQHWIPQSYLRRFSPNGSHVWVFDRPTDKVVFSRIRNLAQSAYFYDQFMRDHAGALPADVPAPVIEQEFSKWESALSVMTKIARRVAAGGGAGLDERLTMAICVAVQLVRTPSFREALAGNLTEALEEDANAYLQRERPDLSNDVRATIAFPPEWAAALHAEYIWRSGQVQAIAADVYNYIWRIGVNRTRLPLCTSDAPIVAFPHDVIRDSYAPEHPDTPRQLRRVVFGGKPFKGLELFYPLDPETAIMMYHPVFFGDMMPSQGKPHLLAELEVLHYNALQVLACERQAYAREDIFQRVREHAASYVEA